MRFLPRSLGGQLAVLLIAALVVAQAASFFLFTGDRAEAIRAANRAGLLESMGSVMRILARAPASERPALAQAATTEHIRYWITDKSTIAQQALSPPIPPAARFDRLFAMSLPEPPRLALLDNNGEQHPRPPANAHHDLRHRPPWDGPQYDVIASVPFPDGGWLNAQTQVRAEPVTLPWPSIISAFLMVVAILAIVGFTVRRATRPLAALATSAEAFGRGGPSQPLPEAGPSEVRRLTAAFNRMQERLERFIADRTRMLAAVGHDLRTPITSLKLRTELLDDEEARTKMTATLDDMQRITEATLAFARDDAASEAVRSVDLQALVESLVDDQSALGKDVIFRGNQRLPYSCRPTALKRAIGNLLENAVRYG